jgi:phosphate transport system permease protein
MLADHANKAHRDESIALVVLRSASTFFILSIGLLIVYLAVEGTKLFTVDHKSIFEFLFSPTFSPDQGKVGALPFILGSLFVTGFAILVGGPFGVAVGVFFSELAPKRVAAASSPKPVEPVRFLMSGTSSVRPR